MIALAGVCAVAGWILIMAGENRVGLGIAILGCVLAGLALIEQRGRL